MQLLGAALAKSGPLDFPSEKSFFQFFVPEKGNSILLQVTRCIQLVHRQNMETSAEIFLTPV